MRTGVDTRLSVKVSRDGWCDDRQEGYIQRILLVTIHIQVEAQLPTVVISTIYTVLQGFDDNPEPE